MAIEITGLIPAQLSNAKGDAAGQAGRNEPSVAQRQTGKTQTTNTVTLTDTSSQLRKIETMMSILPVMDMARVQDVQRALKSGQFNFNPARVAEKMLHFEDARRQAGHA